MKKKAAKTTPLTKAKHGGVKVTVLLDNSKVRAIETRFKPGGVHTNLRHNLSRVSRVLSGGTLLRTYADGRSDKVVWKTGEVRFFDRAKTAPGKLKKIENVGKTEVALYIVMLK